MMSVHMGNVYFPSRENDLEIVRWWVRMDRDGDLDKLMMEGSRSVSDLFRLIQPPKTMLWLLDDEGVWFAMWFEQCFNGVFCGAWMRQDYRGRRAGTFAFLDAWTWALVAWPVLIGVTKQPDLVGIHRRVGYTVMGSIPGLFDGQEATVMYLTRAAFRETLRRLRRPTKPLDDLLDPPPVERIPETTNGVGR